MRIGKERKNEIAQAIRQSVFSPADFETGESPDAIVLTHKPTRARLVVGYGAEHAAFNEDPNNFYVIWNIGQEPEEHFPTDDLGPAVEAWLKAIKRDLETPDLFAEIGKEPLSELMGGEDNAAFTKEEQARIAAVLGAIKREAADGTYGDLPEDELVALNAKMDYLIEASKHDRRRDWLILAVTLIGGQFVAAALSPEVVNAVLNVVSTGLGALFGHPPLLGLPGG